MLEVASYRTPNPLHHITYKDKAAPPKDWSQFLLDPLITQQVYDVLHHKLQDSALLAASNIRSFLEMDSLLPPPKTLPHTDPTLFQRLGHTFTRKQWLNTVRKCRSKLYTGFPSEHYLLVTEVQVRLAAKSPRTPKPPSLRIDFTESSRTTFNAIVKELWEEPSDTSDHNAEVSVQGPKVTVYTKGSGTRGRCSKNTPAGWGWCYKNGEEWTEASGPVHTDPQHPQYYGAQIGSNNTGELTAILEAVIYAACRRELDHHHRKIRQPLGYQCNYGKMESQTPQNSGQPHQNHHPGHLHQGHFALGERTLRVGRKRKSGQAGRHR